MTIELELKRLCEEFMEVLIDLRNRKEISDEELKIHLKKKLDFLIKCEEIKKCRSI